MVRQLRADGWECHVALPAPSPLAAEFDEAGAHLHVVAMRRLSGSAGPAHLARYVLAWPVTVLRLWRLARALRPTVLHSNSLHSWYGWAVAALQRVPHVWHAREIVVQSDAALRLERWLVANEADLVVAVSGAVAAGIDPPTRAARRRARVVVVYDEPDPVRFAPSRAGALRHELGIDEATPLVGTLGRVDTWKGFEVLMDAVEAIRAEWPATRFVFAGPAVEGKEGFAAALEARARALGGAYWLGERSDPATVLADLDVFVLASTSPEPFGQVMTEALSCGVPVVATAAGGPLEVLGGLPPSAARLVPPSDAAALAAAVAALLAGSPATTAQRQRRPRLRSPQEGELAGLFDEVASAGRRRFRAGGAPSVG